MKDSQVFRCFLDLAGERHEVAELRGQEALSAPFRFELRFTVTAAQGLDPDKLLKREAALVIAADGAIAGESEVSRRQSGIITRASLGASVRGVRPVTLVIEPRLSLARHRTDMRVFRDRSVPEIVSDTLSQIGVVPEERLARVYEQRPYCVQMRETDLAFVERLLAEEGIFYFFRPSGVLVLGDSPAAYEPIPGPVSLAFRAASGLDAARESVHAIGHRTALAEGRAPGKTALSGRSSSGRLAPGFSFRLEEAPLAAYNRGHVVSAVEHAWRRQDGPFALQFEALPDDFAWRPPRAEPGPQLWNPMTGFVTGPPGDDDVHTDAMGQVHIHFRWERRIPPGERSSHLVPVLQDCMGGSSAVPRRGWEVLVHYQEGNPDRPVVLGRVYNGADPFPAPLPEQKLVTALRSLSSPSRDGNNELSFDDRAGHETLLLHAELDHRVQVAHDRNETVLGNETSVVRRDELITVAGQHAAAIGAGASTVVAGAQALSTGGDRARRVAGAENAAISGARSLVVGGDHVLRAQTSSAVAATNLRETIGGGVVEVAGGSSDSECGRDERRIVGGSSLAIAGAGHSETAKLERNETIGGALLQSAGGALKIQAGEARSTRIAGALAVEARERLALTGAESLSASAGSAAHEAAKTLTLKVGQSQVRLADGLITIETPGTISLAVSGENNQGAGRSEQL